MKTQRSILPKTTHLPFSISSRSMYSILNCIVLLPFVISYITGTYIPLIDEVIDSFEMLLLHQSVGQIWEIIIGYLLISLTACMIIRIFKPLKSLLELGLITILLSGLILIIIAGGLLREEMFVLFFATFFFGLIIELTH